MKKFRSRWMIGLTFAALFSVGLIAAACEDDNGELDDPGFGAQIALGG